MALEQIANVIPDESETLSPTRKEQALELIEDGRKEIERDHPNSLRLGGILQGIGTTVQTLGAAQNAYLALKAAAAL